MSIFENVNRVLEQARNGNASEPELQQAYDHVARNAPSQAVQDGLAQAFRSDQTPAFPRMVADLFGRSQPPQKAGLLNTLLGKLDPSERPGALGNVPAAAAPRGAVTPEQAQQVPPQQVEALAGKAERKDPSVVEEAAAFYSQHPDLVKGLGAAALTILLARASQTGH